MVNLIIPTYKARDTLPAALDSLVAQTKKMFIVTIVQDADNEDYTDIINEYRHRGLQIKLLQKKRNSLLHIFKSKIYGTFGNRCCKT